jgi:hypothetical protein
LYRADGTVYKHVLIHGNLKEWKERSRTGDDWEKSTKEVKVGIGI